MGSVREYDDHFIYCKQDEIELLKRKVEALEAIVNRNLYLYRGVYYTNEQVSRMSAIGCYPDGEEIT